MTKTLSYSLFGIGKIPEQLAVQLKSEGMVLWDEGIRGSATYQVQFGKWHGRPAREITRKMRVPQSKLHQYLFYLS